MRRLDLNNARDAAESTARTLADMHEQSYLVHYCGSDEHGEIWRVSPQGDRPYEPWSPVASRFTVAWQPWRNAPMWQDVE